MNIGRAATTHRLERLRAWLVSNLPPARPVGMHHATWDTLADFAAGATVDQLADRAGTGRKRLMLALRRGAAQLGYDPDPFVPWVRPDGTLSPDAVAFDPATGCLRWRGPVVPGEPGPRAVLPTSLRDSAARVGRGPTVAVRDWLYRRAVGPIPAGYLLRPRCGDVHCVDLGHATLVPGGAAERDPLTPGLRASRAEETAAAAARRTGLSADQVTRRRGGPVAPRGPRRSPSLRDRLAALPPDRPAAIDEQDWRCARAYVAGRTMAGIGADLGVTRQAVHQRLERVARQLASPPSSG